MKKSLLFLVILVMSSLLVACGNGDLDSFVKDFNKSAKAHNVHELDPDDFGEIEDEENMSWKNLYESDEYYIEAKYKDGKNLSGYYLVIENSQPYEDLEGDGFMSGVAIAEAIGSSEREFTNEFESALNEGTNSYDVDGYKVSFTYPGESGLTSVGMIINFDKE